MTGLIPFNRRRNELDNLGSGTLYNMLDDFFTDSWYPGRTLSADTFKLDVREKEGMYVIEAELPGVNKKEIDLDLSRERLTITVNREESKLDENESYVHRERRICTMSRSIHLGDTELGDITAALNDGILTIQIPKKAPVTESTKIKIA
jgi:HSP20 family protein